MSAQFATNIAISPLYFPGWCDMPPPPLSYSPGSFPAAIVSAFVPGIIKAWHADTQFESSIRARRAHPAYSTLYGYRWAAVPALVKALKGPMLRVECMDLLMKITGDDPVPDADVGYVDRMANAWIAWGRVRGFT